MTSKLPRVAVDSCVIVDFLTGNDPELAARARFILDKHDDEHIVLLPAIVLAEVPGCGAINGDHDGQDARDHRVRRAQLWLRDSGFIVADLSERVARHAGTLASTHKLKGPDASVLATALAWNCRTLYTRDRGLLKVQGLYNSLVIREPEPVPQPELPQDLFSDPDAG